MKNDFLSEAKIVNLSNKCYPFTEHQKNRKFATEKIKFTEKRFSTKYGTYIRNNKKIP